MSINIEGLIKTSINKETPQVMLPSERREQQVIDPLFLPRGMGGDRNTSTLREFYNPRRGTRSSSTYDNFIDWDDERVMAFMEENHYINPRKLEDGSWCAISRLITTWSVCTDITPTCPYAYRWCFLDKAEADLFLATVVEFDDIPVVKESLKGHRFHDGQSRYVRYENDGFKEW